MSEIASADTIGQAADQKKKKKKNRKKHTVTTQIVFSPKVSFDEGKIIEGRGPATNAEGKDLRSLDFPMGRDDTTVRLSERERVWRKK